jgi:hypothetical protein
VQVQMYRSRSRSRRFGFGMRRHISKSKRRRSKGGGRAHAGLPRSSPCALWPLGFGGSAGRAARPPPAPPPHTHPQRCRMSLLIALGYSGKRAERPGVWPRS